MSLNYNTCNGLDVGWTGAERKEDVTMWYKNHEKCWKIPRTNLQLFAERNGGSHRRDGGVEAETGMDEKERSKAFDNFLRQRENQAEFDRRVQKATQTAVNHARKKWEALAEKEDTEYQADRQQRVGKICITLEY